MPRRGPTSHVYFSQRLRLHYVDWGNEDAPPMLLVHGGRDHCRNWDWVAEDLSRDYHIIAPDLRGHGDSQWMIGGDYNQIDYIYDIAQLLRQTKMTPVTIIGHSLGAPCPSPTAACTRRPSRSSFPSRAWDRRPASPADARDGTCTPACRTG